MTGAARHSGKRKETETMLHCIPVATAPMLCDLFGVDTMAHGSCLDPKPRNATEREVRAYFDWLRRRANLPDIGKPALRGSGGTYGQVGGRHNADCCGATFGRQLAPAKWQGQVYTPAQYEDGAYSIPMPGYQRRPATVTLETLDEAGEVVATSTLPVEPKKGGVVWSREAVRAAHGPIAKPAKAKRAKAAPEPVQAASEPVAAATPAPEPENALYEAEIEPETQSEPAPDPIAAILARLDALEAAIEAAPLPVESVATPTEAVQRPRRSPAHERAVRRAWQARREARLQRAIADDHMRMREQVQDALRLAEAARDESKRAAETFIDQRNAMTDRCAKAERKRRRNALFARKRTREMVAAVNHMHDRLDAATQRAGVAEAELERLKADMADPSQPERASDLVQLVRERDEARTALAAVRDRCDRAERARDELAGHVEAMGVRLAKAEAAVRRIAA